MKTDVLHTDPAERAKALSSLLDGGLPSLYRIDVSLPGTYISRRRHDRRCDARRYRIYPKKVEANDKE